MYVYCICCTTSAVGAFSFSVIIEALCLLHIIMKAFKSADAIVICCCHPAVAAFIGSIDKQVGRGRLYIQAVFSEVMRIQDAAC